MKQKLVNVYEQFEIICSCSNKKFTAILDENYCEVGKALRLFCTKCQKEKDYKLEEKVD